MRKIIQLIAAPNTMRVHLETLDRTDPHGKYDIHGNPFAFAVKPVCLALVEDGDGYRGILPVSMDSDGGYAFPTESDQFVCLTTD